jgi:tetratricopeptide (TPR) repeat protein
VNSPRLLAPALIVLLATRGAAAPAPAAPSAADLARIDAAAAEHGVDPDLAWTSAIAHVRAGDPSGVERLTDFQTRWPGLRPDEDLEIGKALADSGRDGEALAAFDRALAVDPRSSLAELYRALALRRLGRSDEAEAGLQRVAMLSPELAPETLLLLGISRMKSGDSQSAARLLHTAIELDPAGDTARRAQMLLPQPLMGSTTRWVSLMARSGVEYDSNVTLDSGLPIAGTGGGHADASSVFGAGLVVSPIRSERVDLSLGYRFDGSLHMDLNDYDLQNHLAYVSLLLRQSNRLAWRFDGVYNRSWFGEHDYGEAMLARPNLFLSFGERLGVTHFYADVSHQSYFQKPALTSLDRDGNLYGAGIEQTFAVPGWRPALLTLGARGSRFQSEATKDVLGFMGAYDNTRWEGNVLLRAPLVWNVQGILGLSLAYEHYDHANVLDFLTDNGHGDPTPTPRRDWVADVGVTLIRPVYRHVDAEIGWHFTRRDSNVDLYNYDRHLVGLYFTVHTD